MSRERRGWVLLFGVAAASVALDQATKIWAELDLKERPGRQIELLDCCAHFRYARNPGAAFSLFADRGPAFRKVFFVTASIAAVVLMLWLYRRMGERRPVFEWALGLLVGGAVGNLIDRVRMNEVIDFIDLHIRGKHWPTFNVADIAIVVGIGLVLIDSFRRPKERRRAAGGGRPRLPAGRRTGRR